MAPPSPAACVLTCFSAASASVRLLTHCRRPAAVHRRAEEARRLFRPAVGLLWVLTCIATGRLVPATTQARRGGWALKRAAHGVALLPPCHADACCLAARCDWRCLRCPHPHRPQKRYKPFPMAAVTTRSAHAASQSGFKDLERTAMRLLLRCMGVEVGIQRQLAWRGCPGWGS